MAPPDAPGGHWIHGDSTDELRFFPPLAIQRQAWALSVLRKEGVKSVLDVGCGEGDLLRALISPAPTIAEPPVLPAEPSADEVADNTFLHIETLAGLDVDRGCLEGFASFHLPPEAPPAGAAPNGTASSGYAPRRWTDLTVSLWQGDLTAFNGEFCSFGAIVALEVIEHLDPAVLNRFAPMILGEYRPRLLLVSTPNYSFNQRFDRQGMGKRGFLDPTGRTQRVFRNDDHRMEWTPAEFQTWAADAAKEFGYTVSTSLVGRPLGDAPAPTADSTAASQVAVFTLAAPDQPSRSPRSLVPASLPFFHPDGNTLPRHALVRRATLAALGAAGSPASDQELREEVRGLMGDWGRGELGLTELWPEMAEVAGGSRRALIRALGGWGNVPPPAEPTASRPSTPATSALLDPAEFTVFLDAPAPAVDNGSGGAPVFSTHALRVRWRDFLAEAASPGPSADGLEAEDDARGFGDDGDGWGPVPRALRTTAATAAAGGVNGVAEADAGGW